MRLAVLLEKVRSALQSHLCWHCGEKAVPDPALFCTRCAERLAIRPPGLMQESPETHAATELNSAVKRVLYAYKFYDEAQYAPQLAALLTHYWRALPLSSEWRRIHPENVLVIPIPPRSGKKSRVDTYVARFARSLGYDYAPRGLSWCRDVVPQHTLEQRTARRANVAGSLAADADKLAGYTHILVVDDITTTGATLREALRAIAAAGPVSGGPSRMAALAVTKVPYRAAH